METRTDKQWTHLKNYSQDDYLPIWVEAFLQDRQTGNKAKGTLYFYEKKLLLFMRFCETQAITQITQITPGTIREYLTSLEETGHNPGGRHAAYRTLKTFLRWWESETEPEGWKNPIKKVAAPRVPEEVLEPVSLEDVKALVKVCKPGTFHGERDRALILALLDTGARASEVLDLKVKDVSIITGETIIRQGKGRKSRTVFMGQRTRKALRSYLKFKPEGSPWLWVTEENEPLTYFGLRSMFQRRAKDARIEEPTAHDFRRAFAIGMLRAGVDIYTLKELMGHSDLSVLIRYLKIVSSDLGEAHRRGGPVDKNL